MIATMPALCMLLEEAAHQAYEQRGRWERQYVCRKMMGFGVDSLGCVDGKALLSTWHLVKTGE